VIVVSDTSPLTALLQILDAGEAQAI